MTNPSTKLSLTVLSLAALFLAGLLVLDWRNIKSKNIETAELLSAAGATTQAENEAESIRVFQREAKDDIASLEALTLNSQRLVGLIESIEEAGRTLNLDLEIASVEKKEGEGQAPELLRIAVNAKGSWGSAYALLKAVESLPHRVMIESVGLVKSGNAWEETLVFSLHSFK